MQWHTAMRKKCRRKRKAKNKIKIKKKIKLFRDIICQYSETKNKDLNIVNEKSIINSKLNYGDKE